MNCNAENPEMTAKEVNLSGGRSKPIKEAVASVVSIQDGPVKSEQLVAEALAVLDMSGIDYEQLGRTEIAKMVKREVGTLKNKGTHRIMDAHNEDQREFSLELGEGTLLTLDEDTVIPTDLAKVSDLELHHWHNTAARNAKIENLQTAQVRESKAVKFLAQNMDPTKSLSDYNNGNGVAVVE